MLATPRRSRVRILLDADPRDRGHRRCAGRAPLDADPAGTVSGAVAAWRRAPAGAAACGTSWDFARCRRAATDDRRRCGRSRCRRRLHRRRRGGRLRSSGSMAPVPYPSNPLTWSVGSIGSAPATAPTRRSPAVGLRLAGSVGARGRGRFRTPGAAGTMHDGRRRWYRSALADRGRSSTCSGSVASSTAGTSDRRDTDGIRRLYIDLVISTSGPDPSRTVVEVTRRVDVDARLRSPGDRARRFMAHASRRFAGDRHREPPARMDRRRQHRTTTTSTSLLAGHIAATDVGAVDRLTTTAIRTSPRRGCTAWFEGVEAGGGLRSRANIASLPDAVDITYWLPARGSHTIESGIDGDVVACVRPAGSRIDGAELGRRHVVTHDPS